LLTTTHRADIARRLTAEALGTAFLLIAVVGSGIAAQRLSPTDTGLQLLENAIATGVALIALIEVFGPISGAQLNPVVTLIARFDRSVTTAVAAAYIAAQVIGGCVGTITANIMFDRPAVAWSSTARTGGHLWFSEVIATVGLLVIIFGLVRARRPERIPVCVGAWIAGAYFFTSSTSFANPAVTIARTLTDTFAGIKPTSAPMFIAMQLAGAGIAVAVLGVLAPAHHTTAQEPIDG
jgi:glycerol uptake facilitator-like aquaporin